MNKELIRLYKIDQKDRLKMPKDPEEGMKYLVEYVTPRDIDRQKRTSEILRNNKNLEAVDYYHAAMIFQHSSNIKRAISLAKRSLDMNYEKAKWLYAAATDRYLVGKGMKQKFGTQFQISKKGKLKPYPIDKRTSDKTREKYNVPPIKEALDRFRSFYKKISN